MTSDSGSIGFVSFLVEIKRLSTAPEKSSGRNLNATKRQNSCLQRLADHAKECYGVRLSKSTRWGQNKRDIEGDGIIEGLLHPGADAMVVVLGLDDGDRDIGFVIKDVVGSFWLCRG
jgi:hypothetical protein